MTLWLRSGWSDACPALDANLSMGVHQSAAIAGGEIDPAEDMLISATIAVLPRGLPFIADIPSLSLGCRPDSGVGDLEAHAMAVEKIARK